MAFMLTLISNLHKSSPTKSNHLKVVRDLMVDAETIVLCSGHLKFNGITHIKDQLHAATARGAKVTVYSNEYMTRDTERKAITALAEWGIEHIVVRSGFYLHTKIYYFQTRDKFSALIGSANLTSGGFETNEEMSVLVKGVVGDPQHSQIIAHLEDLDLRCRQAQAVPRKRKRTPRARHGKDHVTDQAPTLS